MGPDVIYDRRGQLIGQMHSSQREHRLMGIEKVLPGVRGLVGVDDREQVGGSIHPRSMPGRRADGYQNCPAQATAVNADPSSPAKAAFRPAGARSRETTGATRAAGCECRAARAG